MEQRAHKMRSLPEIEHAMEFSRQFELAMVGKVGEHEPA